MKQFYTVIFIFLTLLVKAENHNYLPPPVVDFTFTNDNTCSGTTIQFTSVVTGDNPFTYSWNFGDASPIVTTANPSHIFTSLGCGSQSFTVTLIVTDVNNLSSTKVKTVVVKQRPDTNFTDVNNVFSPFDNCANAASNSIYTITVGNSSASTACITTYTINWGDGNTQNNATFPATHTYPQLGAYNMVITAVATNGCTSVKNYVVKNVSNPSGGLTSPGSTQNLCAPTTNLQFAISNWGTNSNDTTYLVNYGDGTPSLTFTQIQLEASTYFNAGNPIASLNFPIPHSYTTTSCPGGSFTATLTVTNACSSTPFTTSNIVVLIKPQANFTSPPSACINSSVQFINTTIAGYGQNCNQQAIYTWDFGDGSPVVTTGLTLPQNMSHTYTTAGNYTVTLTAQGFCGVSTISKPICIESPPVPQFTLSNNNGCTALQVTTNNTTSVANSCTPITYQWNVTYAAANCGISPPTAFYTSGTTATSVNPIFNFTTPGNYTISLTASNTGCGSVTSAPQTITVKKPPTVSINTIPNACGSTTINPTANTNSCAPTGEVLTYAWSFPGGSPATSSAASPGSIVYSTPGSYTVSLTVNNSCGSATATQTFAVNLTPTITNAVLSQTICSGQPTVPVTLTSNTPGTNFSWTATATLGVSGFQASGSTAVIPAQTISTTNSNPGTVTYIVTPSVGSCSGTAITYTVTVNPAPAFTTQPSSSTVCLGGTVTTLSVATNATGTVLYQWYSNNTNSTSGGTLLTGETNATYNPPSGAIGTVYYYCIVTLPTGGCANITSNIATVTITPAITITTNPTTSQQLCVGVTIPSAFSIAYTGGTGTPTYQWFLNTTNSTTGGTPISGATAANYTPSVYTNAGTYYYYATVSLNGTGCGAVTTSVAEVVVFADPTIDLQPLVSQTLCQGATPTNLTVNASGGNGAITYQWYSNTANNTTTGTLIATATGSTLIPPTTAVGTQYYYCVINQTATTGCSAISNTAQLIIIAAPNITTHPQSATICQGGTLSALSVTYANGTGTPTYQWYSNTIDATSGGTPVTGETNPTFTPSAAAVGTLYYYCIITLPSSGGCSSITSQTANITITPGTSIASQPLATQDLCIGGTVPVALAVTYSGGTGTASYQWYSNTTNSNVGGATILGATNANFTPAVFTTAGTYYFYVVVTLSGNGCGPVASAGAEVIVTADPVVTTQPLASQSVCQSVVPSALTVSATGGLGAFAYQWYSNTANNNTTGTPIPGATTDSYTPLTTAVATTYYYCVITQPNGIGCNVTSATSTIIVNLAPSFTAQPISSIVCSGSTPTQLSVAYANGVGSPQYQWYSNTTSTTVGGIAIPGATNATYDPPATTVGTIYYYCIVTLPTGGCSDITSDIAEVSINANPIITAKTATICSGAAFSIIPDNATGDLVPSGTTYSWPNPTINPTGAVTGTSAETLQTGISQTLTNNTTSPATATYTVTPIAGSCPGVPFTVIITVNPSVSSNVTVSDITCFGYNNGSIQTNITGGIPFTSGPPYLIAWTGPNGFTSSAPTISALDPGVYNLTIDDAGGCPLAESYTIVEPADITITTDLEKDVTCFGDADGEINITLAGGTGSYIYVWTKDTFPFAATEDIGSLAPGVYVVSVTDTNNCGPKTATFTITEPPLLTVSLQNQTNVLCFGYATGAINVTIAGGTMIEVTPGVFDYQYAWSGPNGFTANTQNLNNIVAGVYNLTVTENAGCVQILSVTITQTNEILVAIATTAITCYGANNASITLTVSGGVGPFQAAWDNLATGFFQNNLSAGTYVITITDATNCQKIITVNIPEAPIFVVNPTVTNISCFGANDGSINLNFVGGIAPVNLTWSDGSTAGTIRNNLAAGTYSVTIIDGVPCTIVRTFTIVEPQPIVLTGNLTDALDCNNANTGAINLLVAGGTPPFVYSWSNGATTEDLINISAGNYSITVTDARGCVKTAQYNIVSPPPIVINVITDTDFNCETHDVNQNFIAQVSGGIPPFQLQWSSGTVSGANNEIMHTETNGTVLLTVTDSNLCVATYPVIVDTPELGFNSFETGSHAYSTYGIYSVVDPIQFNSIVTGDYISISWNFGDGTFSTDLNPVHAYTNPSNYVVTQTVTYPFGCVYMQTITLKVEKGYFLVVPTAFTPNKDGINETLRPVFKGLTSIRLEIYDTWGSLIYSEEGATLKGWDGTLNGANAENGNYYCKVQAHTFYNQIVNENHPFILIK